MGDHRGSSGADGPRRPTCRRRADQASRLTDAEHRRPRAGALDRGARGPALKLATAQQQKSSDPADPRTVGRAHQLLAVINLLDDPTACREHLTAALPAARQAEDSWAEVEILQTFALSYLAQHRPALARPYLNRSRPLAQAAGHRVQLAWELILAGLCDAGDGSFQSAARLLEQGTAAARQVGDTLVELFAWAGLATVELAAGDLRRTATIGASFTGTDARTGLVEHAVAGLTHVAGAMSDPGEAVHALLDLADRPAWRVAGDHVRYRLAAAALLLQAGNLRAAEGTIRDAQARCEAIDSRWPGPAGYCRPGSAGPTADEPRRRHWPTRGWPRPTARACGLSYLTPWKCWAG